MILLILFFINIFLFIENIRNKNHARAYFGAFVIGFMLPMILINILT